MEISVPLRKIMALGNAKAGRSLKEFRERFPWAEVSKNGETFETTTALTFNLKTAPSAGAMIAAMEAIPG